jgi:hypothetical protein
MSVDALIADAPGFWRAYFGAIGARKGLARVNVAQPVPAPSRSSPRSINPAEWQAYLRFQLANDAAPTSPETLRGSPLRVQLRRAEGVKVAPPRSAVPRSSAATTARAMARAMGMVSSTARSRRNRRRGPMR